jgi:hypothetical protein
MKVNDYFYESSVNKRPFIEHLTKHTNDVYSGKSRLHFKTQLPRTWLEIFNQSYHSLICEYYLIQLGYAPNDRKYTDVISPNDQRIEVKTIPTLNKLQSQVQYITNKVKSLPVRNDEVWFFHRTEENGDFKYTLVHKSIINPVQTTQSAQSSPSPSVQSFYDYKRKLNIEYYQKTDKQYHPYKNIGGLWNVVNQKEHEDQFKVIEALEKTYGIHITNITKD